jgi:hypothetical protein
MYCTLADVSRKRNCIAAIVVDGHRFDADPDPNFHFDADQDPDLDPSSQWESFDSDPQPTFHFDAEQNPDSDSTPSFTYVGKSDFFYIYSQQCQFTLFYLSRQCYRCHNFQFFDSILKFSGKIIVLFETVGTDPDHDRALDPYPNPQHW